LVGLEFELRASCLQSSHFTTWATLPVHFDLVVLEISVLKIISLGWYWTEVLLISASQVARIIGVSHHYLAPQLTLISSQGEKTAIFVCMYLFILFIVVLEIEPGLLYKLHTTELHLQYLTCCFTLWAFHFLYILRN
jgi:hypothetical protein